MSSLNILAADKNVYRFLRGPEGWKVVGADLNSLEPHVIAHFSNCPQYMSLYGPNAVPNQDAYIKLGTTIPQFRDKFLEHYNPDAPTIEGVEFITENYPNERFVCKVMFLSCVYGIKAPALRESLAAGKVFLSMREVETLLQSYWRTFSAVKSFSQSLQKQWRDNGGYIISGRGTPRPLDQIGASKDILSRFTQCLAGDTTVLTDRGPVKITEVRPEDLLWDGVEYVVHEGVVEKGEKRTRRLNGVNMTIDHKVLTNEGWKDAEHVEDEDLAPVGGSWKAVWRLGCYIAREMGKKWYLLCKSKMFP